MWQSGGVSDEDRLSRAQARTILGRVFKMAAPFRKTMYIAFACVMVTTATTLSAPVIVRHGIDAGIRARDTGALNLSVVMYLVGVSLTYVFVRVRQSHRRIVLAIVATRSFSPDATSVNGILRSQ